MTIYTIGHSTLPVERLVELLRQHQIRVVVDVRTHPHSAYNPQFNQPALRASVQAAGMDYFFSGDTLGGKPDDPGLRSPDGMPDYDRIAATDFYRRGVDALLALAQGSRVAILCSEADPAQCHREKLIGRTLREQGVQVLHIHPDGEARGCDQLSLL